MNPPLTQQPGNWIPLPQHVPHCPAGLEYLTVVDHLLVHQKIHLMEAFTSFDKANKYMVTNAAGQQAFFAAEVSGACARIFCGAIRGFDVRVADNYQREVLRITRPLRCQTCCFPCCLQKLTVAGADGVALGYVVQEWSFCAPKFRVETATGETVLKIQGPFCVYECFNAVEFQILTKDGKEQIGKISKHWAGLANEMFTDADVFGVQFPMDLDVKVKATLLGACFLIDFMYFESNEK